MLTDQEITVVIPTYFNLMDFKLTFNGVLSQLDRTVIDITSSDQVETVSYIDVGISTNNTLLREVLWTKQTSDLIYAYRLFCDKLSKEDADKAKEALEGKKRSEQSDEFLVEKKSPLVMPPDYNELPIPKEKIEQTDINENEFKTLITQKNQDTKSDSNEDVNKNFEELLLDKIKKN